MKRINSYNVSDGKDNPIYNSEKRRDKTVKKSTDTMIVDEGNLFYEVDLECVKKNKRYNKKI